MEPPARLKAHFLKLHSNKFSGFLRILELLYPTIKCEELEGRLEFSLLINPIDKFDLRFGLFKLSTSDAIAALFETYRYAIPDLEPSFSVMKGFAPEYGVGFDWKDVSPRLKTYFLRLQDNPVFEKEIASRIRRLCEVHGINSRHLEGLDKSNCYLVGTDYYQSRKRNLKIYLRALDVNFPEILKQIEKEGIDSRYFSHFRRFIEGNARDVTFSYKYSNESRDLSGFSVFFEVEPMLNEKVNALIKTCFPERFEEFRNLVGSLETRNGVVHYSHVGITFLQGSNLETVCLYYSPPLEMLRK